MGQERAIQRAVAFIDGQNLYHSARTRFGFHYPNYDAPALARAVCLRHGWTLSETRFYTGIHSIEKDPFWHLFWAGKLAVMGRQPNVVVYTRKVLYVNERTLVGGRQVKREVAHEKGIDVRIALDAVRLARERKYDIALLFSQDSDFEELVKEIKSIAGEQRRQIAVASAYLERPGEPQRGVEGARFISVDTAMYKSCLDRRDYLHHWRLYQQRRRQEK